MAQLEQTQVYRGGLTTPRWDIEYTRCTASIDKSDGSLNVKFNIASKGGGTTCLWVKIGSADVRGLLHELAENRPDTAGTFAESITIAIQQNAQMMERIRDTALMEKLESVVEYIDNNGEDAGKTAAGDDLRSVIRTIRSVRID